MYPLQPEGKKRSPRLFVRSKSDSSVLGDSDAHSGELPGHSLDDFAVLPEPDEDARASSFYATEILGGSEGPERDPGLWSLERIYLRKMHLATLRGLRTEDEDQELERLRELAPQHRRQRDRYVKREARRRARSIAGGSLFPGREAVEAGRASVQKDLKSSLDEMGRQQARITHESEPYVSRAAAYDRRKRDEIAATDSENAQRLHREIKKQQAE